MGDVLRVDLQRVGVLLGVAVAVVALLGAWVLLPYRMEAAEKKIETLELQLSGQREMLARIDENVKLLIKERARE